MPAPTVSPVLQTGSANQIRQLARAGFAFSIRIAAAVVSKSSRMTRALEEIHSDVFRNEPEKEFSAHGPAGAFVQAQKAS